MDLTSHCNLRCTYCHQSQESFLGSHIEPPVLDRLFTDFVEAGVASVRFGTEGEFSIYKGWEGYAEFLNTNGILCSYLSNLSHQFSDTQITQLAKADQLIISFDTYDDEVHAKIRRRSKVDLITQNITKIVARSRELGRKPHITQNCVVTAHNYSHLPNIVSQAPIYGIDKVALLFMIKNFALTDGGLDPIPLDQLGNAEQTRALGYVNIAVNLGRVLGVEVALSTILEEKLAVHRSRR